MRKTEYDTVAFLEDFYITLGSFRRVVVRHIRPAFVLRHDGREAFPIEVSSRYRVAPFSQCFHYCEIKRMVETVREGMAMDDLDAHGSCPLVPTETRRMGRRC